MNEVTMTTRLVLASNSPRRKQLLQLFGIEFDVISADIDETPLPKEPPDQMTLRLAKEKASAVFSQLRHNETPNYCVLGGDTTVSIDGGILGKPQSRDQARTMINQLSGRAHWVYSAVVLMGREGSDARLSSTKVWFHSLSHHQISDYCNSKEPYDKAGGYGIQGRAGKFVQRIEGSYSGVVGLPLFDTHLLLMKHNLVTQ